MTSQHASIAQSGDRENKNPGSIFNDPGFRALLASDSAFAEQLRALQIQVREALKTFTAETVSAISKSEKSKPIPAGETSVRDMLAMGKNRESAKKQQAEQAESMMIAALINASNENWADSTGRRNTFNQGGVYGTTSGVDA